MTEPTPGHGPSKELVTGATGLVGMERLVYRLERGWPTVALRRAGSDVGRVEAFLRERLGEGFVAVWSGLEWREADLSDVGALEDAMEGCARVFHAAGRVSFRPGDEARLKAVNAAGTANVVNAALASGICRLVHISSVAALGRSSVDAEGNRLPVSERSDWAEGAGASPYGISKHAGEMEVWRGVAEGLAAFAVNPTVILGDARYAESSGMIYRRAAKGGRFFPLGGNGYVGVADVVAAVAALDEAVDQGSEDILGERFVVSAEDVLHRDVMVWAAEGLGASVPTRPLAGWMLGFAWRAAWLAAAVTGRPPALTRDLARNTQSVHRYDTSKLRTALPDFRFTSIREVVRQATARGLT